MSNKEIVQRLKNDIKLRSLSQNTLEEYVDRVRIFTSHFDRSVELLSEDDIKEFFLFLKKERKLKNANINTYNSVLRFLYGVTLNKPLNVWQIPRFKQSRALPQLLTQQEIALLLEYTPNPMY